MYAFPVLVRSSDDPEYKKIPPDDIYEFRNLPWGTPIHIPELIKNRSCTDIAFIILFVIAVLGFVGFTAYLFTRTGNTKTSNTNDNDYDDDSDEIQYKKGSIDNQISEKDVLITLIATCVGMLAMTLVAMYILFVCFWYCTACTFYSLFVLTILFFILATIGCWVMFAYYKATQFAVLAIMLTIFLLILFLMIYCYRKKFKLIVLIYEEAFEGIFKVPALLFTPLLTIAVLIIVMIPMIIIVQYIIAGKINMKADIVFDLYMFYATFMAIWWSTFLNGAQTVVVAGCIATFYFTRDKSNLGSPYCTSMWILIRFHLGTIAAGSLIITIIRMLRHLAERAQEQSTGCLAICFCLIGSCLACLEEIIEYLTRKAYVMTAIHGRSLCASGKRACRLLWANLIDTIAVDSLGGFSMIAAELLILFSTYGIGVGIAYSLLKSHNLQYQTFYICILPLPGLIMASLVCFYYFLVVMVAIDTIFLCFCEDKVLNDGSRSRPYCMSQRLLSIIYEAFELARGDDDYDRGAGTRYQSRNAPPPQYYDNSRQQQGQYYQNQQQQQQQQSPYQGQYHR